MEKAKSTESIVREIKRRARKKYSSEEKIRIIEENNIIADLYSIEILGAD